jgi:hypothetical protein
MNDLIKQSTAVTLIAISLMEKCIGQTIEDAVSRINRPLLTALHRGRMNRMRG